MIGPLAYGDVGVRLSAGFYKLKKVAAVVITNHSTIHTVHDSLKKCSVYYTRTPQENNTRTIAKIVITNLFYNFMNEFYKFYNFITLIL